MAGAYLAEFIGTLVFAITATATSAGLAQAVAGPAYGSPAIVLVNGLAPTAVVGPRTRPADRCRAHAMTPR
ncbi:MAG: hypothetical protein QOI83_4073 [Streptomycetaceae bacterium]|nr:hypothetical protein [Streptomycetaceae bacterium]